MVINKLIIVRDRIKSFSLFVFLFFSCNVKATEPPVYLEISKDDYYDKTLACILGQIGGFLSGFEFVKIDGQPYVGLPDDWYVMCYGPYGGGPKRGSAGNNCVIANGQIRQDDDYHVDIFNQLIFSQSVDLPTSLDIQRLWKYHQVRDWGGGAKAMEIMNKFDFIPPFTGQLEYGNIYSWCTEPYIENETVGCVAPGMPQTADMLVNRFALTTGEYESVIWARFFGVMYSVAYFENDAVTAMKKASAILPAWSYARFMYEKAIELHQKHPDNWRNAAREITQYGRHIYKLDNVQVAYDINGAFTVLSVLYGNNSYYETIKIASLIGYDSDCTAATVGGLLGIIKGMEGTDPSVKEVVYNNGEGVLVNDGVYIPYIRRHYPERQKFTDIAVLYQQNTERVILEREGLVLDGKYLIKPESVKSATGAVLPNRDFEDDYVEVYRDFINGAQGGVDKIQSFSPHSGDRTARIVASQEGASGKVYLKTENLEVGKTYKVGGYLVAKGENKASLFVQNGSQFLTSSTYNNDSDWYNRTVKFTAIDTKADVGLYVPPIKAGLFNAYLDDITIDECVQNMLVDLEAETLADQSDLCTPVQSELLNASQNGYLSVEKASKIKGISVNAVRSGEYLMRIRFSNASGDVVTARIMNSSDAQAKFPFFVTGGQPFFEENVVEVPLHLKKGSNQLSIEQFSGDILIDKIEIVSDSSHFLISNSDTSETINIRKDPYSVKVYSSKNNLIIEQDEYGYSQAIITSPDGKSFVNLKLYPYKASYNLSNLESGIYLISLLGRAGKKTLKFINH